MSTGSKTDNRLVIFYITREGFNLAGRIAVNYTEVEVSRFDIRSFADRWSTEKNIICIMAAGIVVRTAAPLLQDKKTDPAVVVLDEKGEFAISLISGHLGGANQLARDIAGHLGGTPVITTASDVQGKIALDLWARDHGLFVEDFRALKNLSTKIVNGEKINVYSEYSYEKGVPEEFQVQGSYEGADLIISPRDLNTEALCMRPPVFFAGIGCNRGTTKEEIYEVVRSVMKEAGFALHSLCGLASIDLKSDEQGMLQYAEESGLNIVFYSKEELNRIVDVCSLEVSDAVMKATGAKAVAEPAALISAMSSQGLISSLSEYCELAVNKQKRGNVTLAIAKVKYTL
ncbi:MAG: cobalamin biosynthesis protein [Nitrospira sp.]|nr:cobalamin biosynthesis protein [bacterium]MBL7048706.1 cobalamin biosynthesis protein [Nitrospira sp.]